MMNEQRIVFMGTPQFAADILEGLYKAGYNIVGVVTQPDKEFGRKKELRASEVKNKALELGIPVLTPARIRIDYEDVLALKPDLIITSAYGQIIPKELLDCPKYHCINTHGSLLPAYRGGSPIQTAIINGEKQTGMTIMYMNEKMDEGDILYQRPIDIAIEDTNSTMFVKLSRLALEMLLELLPELFKGNIHPVAQDHEKATYAPILKKEIEHVSFDDVTLNVYNHIRGLLDNPGAYTVIKDRKYKLEKVFYELETECEAGIFKGLEKDYLRFDCRDGFIKVYMIKPEGKNSMDAKAFYNGAGRNLAGERLG